MTRGSPTIATQSIETNSLVTEPQVGGVQSVTRQASIRLYGFAFDKLLGYVFALFVVKTYGPATSGLYLFGVSLIELLLLLAKMGLDRSAIRAIASLNAKGQTVENKISRRSPKDGALSVIS